MKFFRQRLQCLIEQNDLLRLHRKFALIGAHQHAAHSNNIAHLPMLSKTSVGLLAEIILRQITLNLPGNVLQGYKTGLTHDPA